MFNPLELPGRKWSRWRDSNSHHPLILTRLGGEWNTAAWRPRPDSNWHSDCLEGSYSLRLSYGAVVGHERVERSPCFLKGSDAPLHLCPAVNLVRPVGIEPTTFALRGRCCCQAELRTHLGAGRENRTLAQRSSTVYYRVYKAPRLARGFRLGVTRGLEPHCALMRGASRLGYVTWHRE
jgi:hypothetical protein